MGGGWIGAEVAACARQLGADVTLLPGRQPLLERHLGARWRGSIGTSTRGTGSRPESGVQVVELKGRDGRLAEVHLSDGSVVQANALVVGIGAEPRLDDGSASRAGDRCRSSGGSAVPHQRPGRVRGRGHRRGVASAVRAVRAARPLGRGVVRRTGGRQIDARQGRALRAGPVPLQRPVRPEHGGVGGSARVGSGGRASAIPREEWLPRVLAQAVAGWSGRCWAIGQRPASSWSRW